MKTLDENDPRLTAYALDELDTGEREAVETFLAGNSTARTTVEEIRETAALLREEFRGEPALALGAKQREAVLGNEAPAADEEKIVRPGGFSRVSRLLGIAAVAACLCAVSVVGLRHYMDEASRPGAEAPDESVTVTMESAPEGALASSGMKAEGGEAEVSDGVRLKDSSTKDAKESGALALSQDEIAPNAPAPGGLLPPDIADDYQSAKKEYLDAVAGNGDVQSAREKMLDVMEASIQDIGPDAPQWMGASATGVPPSDVESPSPEVRAPSSTPSEDSAPETAKNGKATATQGAMPEMPTLEATPFAATDSAPAPGRNSAVFGDGLGGGGAGDGFGRAPADRLASAGMRESKQLRSAGKPELRGAVAPSSSIQPADKPQRKMAELQKAEDDAAAPAVRSRTMLPPAEESAGAAGERYAPLVDNPFVSTWVENVSTFSIDVDNAAYSNIRRFVTRNHQLPPKDAVRIEEMINYFDYDYPQPADKHPFSVNLEVASCPWEKEARLVRIGLKGLEMHPNERPASNLVFLIDVSGSMSSDDKLPLLQSAMMSLVDGLNEDDSIAIVVYAGSSGLVLDSTSGDLKGKIKEALGKLQSGGSTNGGQGIELAYATAKRHFIEGGVNRVVLASDGDFNVGVTSHEALVAMVEERAKNDAIFLTVLGFGQGNLNDNMMEQIADKGNGNYFYIDNGNEGQRVLVDRLSATLVTIAKDVKIQVDFNPAKVARYRLIGYANRMLENKDFRDDAKDAGEIGAGHTVTALYQVLPAGTGKAVAEAKEKARVESEESKYLQPKEALADADAARTGKLVASEELLTVRLRYKQPDGEKAEEFEVGITDAGTRWEEASGDFRFAASVAGYGMLLRDSEYKGLLNYDLVLELADEGKGSDPHGLRTEFIDIVKASQELAGQGE